MQPILGLIDYNGLDGIYNFVGNDDIAAHGQTVHKQGIICPQHLRLIDDPFAPVLCALNDVRFRIAVEVLAAPAFRVYDVGVGESFIHRTGQR